MRVTFNGFNSPSLNHAISVPLCIAAEYAAAAFICNLLYVHATKKPFPLGKRSLTSTIGSALQRPWGWTSLGRRESGSNLPETGSPYRRLWPRY